MILSNQRQRMVFHRIPMDSTIPESLFSILADFNNAVVCMLSILCPLSSSTSLFFDLLWSVHSSPTIIGITFTYFPHSFFSSQARYEYEYIFLLSFIFTLWSAETAKYSNSQVLIVFFSNIFFGLLTLGEWVECLPMIRESRVQPQIESYQRLLKNGTRYVIA